MRANSIARVGSKTISRLAYAVAPGEASELVFTIDGLNRLITSCLTQYVDNFFAIVERLFREYFF